MTDSKETPKEELESTEEVELTDEQKQVMAWMSYVTDEVNTLLNMFLPFSKSSSVGVLYKRAVTAVYESGPQYDPHKAEGVEIRILFDFANVQEIPKPTPEEE
jgi:hypothetical protein